MILFFFFFLLLLLFFFCLVVFLPHVVVRVIRKMKKSVFGSTVCVRRFRLPTHTPMAVFRCVWTPNECEKAMVLELLQL